MRCKIDTLQISDRSVDLRLYAMETAVILGECHSGNVDRLIVMGTQRGERIGLDELTAWRVTKDNGRLFLPKTTMILKNFVNSLLEFENENIDTARAVYLDGDSRTTIKLLTRERNR